MPTLATHKTCTGCMACLDRCPFKAISIIDGADGHKYISVDESKCTECGLCTRTCPVVNGTSPGDSFHQKASFFAAWANDTTIRKHGATSGLFGAIAADFISAGNLVAGAIISGCESNYILCDDLNQLVKIQGSKYTWSNPSGIYAKILEALRRGRTVLFGGLPCHAAALRSYVPTQLQENLYIIDIVCGGVSSPLLIKKFKEFSHMSSIISFRDKDSGWKPSGFRYRLKYLDCNGNLISQKADTRNLITDGFACALTNRHSCYNCRFANVNRISDLTIGDLWGDTQFPNQHHDGVSSIIAHTPKGLRLLNSPSLTVHPISARDVLQPNYRISVGKSIKGMLPERLWFSFLIRHLSMPSILKVYCSDLSLKDILWLPFSVYRVLTFRLDRYLGHKRNLKILSRQL